MSRKNRSRKQQDPKPRAAAEASPVVDTDTLVEPAESGATPDAAVSSEADDTIETIDTVDAIDTIDTIDTVETIEAVATIDTVETTETVETTDAVETVDAVDAAEDETIERVESVALESDAAEHDADAEADTVDIIVDEAEGDTVVDVIVDADADAETVVVVEADGTLVGEALAEQDAVVEDAVDAEAVARANAASYDRLKPIIEALIFASPEPLSTKTLFKLLESEPKEDVETALAMLRADYDHPGGLQLVEVAGGFQIVTRPELHEYVRRLFHERTSSKLSVQALETLAVIAYKQPITAPEITEIRGVNTSGVLNTLIDRKLVKIVGRKNVVGRPFMYATTRDFLDKFGLNDLTDLPKVEDLADVLGFEPPSLDANEPSAETLAFDFGDPEEGGLVAISADDALSDAGASATSDTASTETIESELESESESVSPDEEPIIASDDDSRIFAIVDEVVEEHADDAIGEQVGRAPVEDIDEPSVDEDRHALNADDAHDNASTDTDREPSSNEDEIL